MATNGPNVSSLRHAPGERLLAGEVEVPVDSHPARVRVLHCQGQHLQDGCRNRINLRGRKVMVARVDHAKGAQSSRGRGGDAPAQTQ
eukprot:7930200-Pyramimonas_sp.AAC.1